MARVLGSPTFSAPYFNHFDTADLSLASVDADQAPVILGDALVGGKIVLTFGANVAGANPEWHLIVARTDMATSGNTTSAENYTVVAVYPSTSSTPSATRTAENDNGGSIFIHTPVAFDTSGLANSLISRTVLRAYIALANLSTATDTYLINVGGA